MRKIFEIFLTRVLYFLYLHIQIRIYYFNLIFSNFSLKAMLILLVIEIFVKKLFACVQFVVESSI